MKRYLARLIIGSLLCLAPFASAGQARAVALADVAGSYAIDRASVINFAVGQVGGGGITGDFGKFSGTFQLDGSNVGRSVVQFELFPDSVRTGQQRVDDFLRSSAVFDVAHYPSLSFRSVSVTQTGPETATIEGLLTARGKTGRAKFEAKVIDGERRGISFHVTGEVFRSPFGMDVGTPIYSNVVRFDMMLHGTRR